MKIGMLVCSALVCFRVNGTASAEPRPYVPLGPPETADFERGLDEIQPGYTLGVGLSDARWQTGQKATDLSPADAERLAHYQNSVAAWLAVILRAELQPAPSAKTEWPLFRKLRWDVNFICGRHQSQARDGPYQKAQLHFASTSFYLDLTVASETLFSVPAETMSDEEVIEAAAKVVCIPLERDISVVKRVASVAGRTVCHGTIWIDLDEQAYNDNYYPKGRHWWSMISFWYVQGRMNLGMCTWDFTRNPPISTNTGWRFTENSAGWSTTRPGIPPRKFPKRKVLTAADLYVPQGAIETADFERGLFALKPVFAHGVPLGAERWATALKAEDLSPADATRFEGYLSTIAGWVDQMLQPELRPAPDVDGVDWRVLPRRFSTGTDLIVGRWTVPQGRGLYAGAKVELRASRLEMYVTVASDGLFSPPADAELVHSDDQVMGTVRRVLRIPPRGRKPAVAMQLTVVAGRKVCRGLLKYGWYHAFEADSTKLRTRRWWSTIDYWFTQGRAFVSVSTWNWAGGPPESPSASWPFEEDYAALRDEQARMPKTEAEKRSPLMPDGLIMGCSTTRPMSGRSGGIRPPNAN